MNSLTLVQVATDQMTNETRAVELAAINTDSAE